MFLHAHAVVNRRKLLSEVYIHLLLSPSILQFNLSRISSHIHRQLSCSKMNSNSNDNDSITVGELLKQGAEARLYLGSFLGKKTVIKERFVKKYRHPDLHEKLTKERMRAEMKGILRCKQIGIRTPTIYFVDSKANAVHMEFLENVETVNIHIGRLLQGCTETQNGGTDELKLLAADIGATVGKMHMAGIIHGDLTTSNILIQSKCEGTSGENKPRLALIDFGLSHLDNSAEDKGVDLYVLERALNSTFSNIPWFFETILTSYRSMYTNGGEEVYRKLEEIRLRGRKRTMVG